MLKFKIIQELKPNKLALYLFNSIDYPIEKMHKFG